MDLLDGASRNPAPNGRPIQHVRQVHVIDVARLPGEFVAALQSRNGSADNLSILHTICRLAEALGSRFSDGDSVRQEIQNRTTELWPSRMTQSFSCPCAFAC